MSCLRAAGAVRCETRHRAQISRFLARPRWRKLNINKTLRSQLLELEVREGMFVFIIDATLVTQAGKKTENTYSTGNRQRRPCKGRRYGKTKHARKKCHSFTMGLLITPSGIRIPFCKPYHTHEYCKETGREHRTTAEAAADLIRELPLPEGAKVVVLGDTAYDAEVVRDACQDRGYSWIFPCNPERVLAGPKGKRPKVRSLLKDWSNWSRQTVRLAPGQGPYAVYRRLSPHRIGPKAKPRTYYVHQERRQVHSVGEVRLVFSTTEKNLKTATPDDVKILMTNDQRLSLRDVIELYSLRWQIELFFKELKSTLGFHQYQFQKFESGGRLGGSGAHAFMYLEWYRAKQISRRDLSRRGERLVGASADVRPVPSSPFGKRAKRTEVHRGSAGNPRRDTCTQTAGPQQLSQGIQACGVNLIKNSATSKSASEAPPSRGAPAPSIPAVAAVAIDYSRLTTNR